MDQTNHDSGYYLLFFVDIMGKYILALAQFLTLDEVQTPYSALDYSSNIGVWGRNPSAVSCKK
jgi:hypothetical protein